MNNIRYISLTAILLFTQYGIAATQDNKATDTITIVNKSTKDIWAYESVPNESKYILVNAGKSATLDITKGGKRAITILFSLAPKNIIAVASDIPILLNNFIIPISARYGKTQIYRTSPTSYINKFAPKGEEKVSARKYRAPWKDKKTWYTIDIPRFNSNSFKVPEDVKRLIYDGKKPPYFE